MIAMLCSKEQDEQEQQDHQEQERRIHRNSLDHDHNQNRTVGTIGPIGPFSDQEFQKIQSLIHGTTTDGPPENRHSMILTTNLDQNDLESRFSDSSRAAYRASLPASFTLENYQNLVDSSFRMQQPGNSVACEMGELTESQVEER